MRSALQSGGGRAGGTKRGQAETLQDAVAFTERGARYYEDLESRALRPHELHGRGIARGLRRVAAADRRAGPDAAEPRDRSARCGHVALKESKRRTRRPVVAAVGAVASLLVIGGAFYAGMLPDVPAMIREPFAVAMLENRADQSSFERFLRVSGADWHKGYGYQRGEAFSSFDAVSRDACVIECDSVVQTAFTKSFGICFIKGDVVSARFDKKGQLQVWNLDEAVDGC